MEPLFTVGYEGHTIETFVDLLKANLVEHVIDVRRVPSSRKPKFSKNTLSHALACEAIEYTHIVDLGTPEQLRTRLKLEGDYDSFFLGVDDYIRTQDTALNFALDLASSRRCALLCLEADPNLCHRSVVASQIARLSRMELTVEHI